jgi:predicted nucleic acid-binding protein
MDDSLGVPTSGLLDTCVVIDYEALREQALPDLQAISSVTLAELHAGPHFAQNNAAEQVQRQQVLRHAERTFPSPLPFDTTAAQIYGSVNLLTLAAGRKPRKYQLDLMIASIAIANRLPLYTRNPKDFEPLRSLLDIREV